MKLSQILTDYDERPGTHNLKLKFDINYFDSDQVSTKLADNGDLTGQTRDYWLKQ